MSRTVRVLGVGSTVALAVFAVASAQPQDDRERWNVATGITWVQHSPDEKLAYLEGFLAGSGLADVEDAVAAADTAALGAALDSLVRGGGLRFPYGSWVYASQLDDYYWWETHTNSRLIFALGELNQQLKRRQ